VKSTKPSSPKQGLLPLSGTLQDLAKEAKGCRNCDLWRNATQTVFGEGGSTAKIIMIGEQPGNREDVEGKPFVGPAGRLMDKLLVEAGIDRKRVYVTNAVKHFKWEPRGKRRIHKKPNLGEIAACRPWLEAEIAALKPVAIVCLGATAAQAIFGRTFRLTQHRGEFVPAPLAPYAMATVHPSAILRAPDDDARHEQEKAFVAALRKLAKLKL
jgi:uracil-DNA glycosylase family protein